MTVHHDAKFDQFILAEARMLQEARVLRDEQPFNRDAQATIARRLREFRDRTGRTWGWIAKASGIGSESVICQLASESYLGEQEENYRAIDKWLEFQDRKEKAPKPPGFAKLKISEAIFGAMSWAIKTSSIAVVHGPTGCGKTITALAYRAETPGCIYISADSAGRTGAAILARLAEAVKLPVTTLSLSASFRHIVGVYKDTGRLIAVDECHKFAGRASDEGLHILRDLHDQTGCPMVWLGNSRIADYVRNNGASGRDPLFQVFGRVSYWLDLSELAEGGGDGDRRLYTVDEIRKVFAAGKLRLTPDAERYLTALANDPLLGCLRHAKHLVLMATVIAGDSPISADLLRKIQRERLGRRSFELVEIQVGEAAKAVA